MKKKKYEELTFTDDFMFCKVLLTNPKLSSSAIRYGRAFAHACCCTMKIQANSANSEQAPHSLLS